MALPLLATIATIAANYATKKVNEKKDREEQEREQLRRTSTYRPARSIDIAQEVGSRLSRRRDDDEFAEYG